MKPRHPTANGLRGLAWPASPLLADLAIILSQLLAISLAAFWTVTVHGVVGWSADGTVRAAFGVLAVGILGRRAWARAMHLTRLGRHSTSIE